mgnify:CR=1 FL=1
MVTPQAQIKITLPLALKDFVESKASRVGLPVASYIKHLILKEVEHMEYPVFEASDRTIRKAKEAMKNKEKSILVEDIDEYFKNL